MAKKTKAEVQAELTQAREDLAAARARIGELETQVKLLTSIVTDAARKEYVPLPYPYAPNPLAPYQYGYDQRSWRCSDGTGSHDYPNVWWGITMPPCRKCGYVPPGINWQQPGITYQPIPTIYHPIPTPWEDPVYYRTTYGPNTTEVTTIGTMTQPSTVCAPAASFDTVGCAPQPSFQHLDLLPRASGGPIANWTATATTAPVIAQAPPVSCVQPIMGGIISNTVSPGVH